MARLRLELAYDGTDFCGWQLQARDRTVQGDLESAIKRILNTEVRAQGSGRTDSGVHALRQTVHFDVPDDRLSIPWVRALNSILLQDVRVLSARVVPESFHSRYDALRKGYAYTLWLGRTPVNPLRRRYVWGCGLVDVDAMRAAAAVMEGTHDFSCFQNSGTPVKTTVRTLEPIRFEAGINEHELVLRFVADGFLKQQVRNMVGCLVEAGRGKVFPETVRSIMDEADRSAAPATAPPQGLCLEWVEYPSDLDGVPLPGESDGGIDGRNADSGSAD